MRTLKGLRADTGLTQAKMAERLGIATPTYSKYENYEIKIPYHIVVKICDICNIKNPLEVKFTR